MLDSKPWQTAAALVFALPLTAALLASTAHAQPVDRYILDRYFPEGVPGYDAAPGVTVLSRLRPEYTPEGVQVGGFTVRPEVNESVGYNDNVLGVGQNPKGSLTENTQATLGAASNWSRNSLGAQLHVDDLRYPSVSGQDRTDWSASVGGTVDIGRDQLAIAATHLSAHQAPTDLDVVQTDKPLPFDLDSLHISYTAPLGRFSVVPSFDYSQLRFSNGTVGGHFSSQKYLDRDIYQGTVQLRYEFAPLRNGIVELRGLDTNYISPNAGQPSLNSDGGAALVGIDYASSAVWRFRALVGFEQRDFSAPQYKTRQAPIAEANVIWTPTGLTTVSGQFLRSIEDPTDQTTQGYNYTSARLLVDHEYLRNVLLRGYIGLQRADYVGVSYHESLYQTGASATWLLNRRLSLTLSYDFTDRLGSAATNPTSNLPVKANYIQNIYLLQARFAL